MTIWELMDRAKDKPHYRDLEEKSRARWRLILEAPKVSEHLAQLEEQGADRETVLGLLDLSARQDSKKLMNQIRERRRRRARLSEDLESTASSLEQLGTDPINTSAWWIRNREPG